MENLNKLILIFVMFLITSCNSSISHKPISEKIEKTTIINGLTYENKPFIEKYNWDNANKYCQEKGWRLPSRVELAQVANIPLYNVNSNNEKGLKGYNKWFINNKSKQNSNLFVKKIFVENMNKGDVFWTSEKDTSQPKEHDYHFIVLFYEGYVGSNEGHLTNNVLCVK